MLRPKNFEKMLDATSMEPLRLGGHYMKILAVAESKNSYGDDMIVLQLDCDERDDQA